jgi:hypothetical protein
VFPPLNCHITIEVTEATDVASNTQRGPAANDYIETYKIKQKNRVKNQFVVARTNVIQTEGNIRNGTYLCRVIHRE